MKKIFTANHLFDGNDDITMEQVYKQQNFYCCQLFSSYPDSLSFYNGFE